MPTAKNYPKQKRDGPPCFLRKPEVFSLPPPVFGDLGSRIALQARQHFLLARAWAVDSEAEPQFIASEAVS
jgi:hypothetical protein